MRGQLRFPDSQILQGMPAGKSLEKLCNVFGYLSWVEEIFISVTCFRGAEAQR